jgi:hypothetical protein
MMEFLRKWPPREVLLGDEVLYSMKGVQELIGMGRAHYNTVQPHSALSYRPSVGPAFPNSADLPWQHFKRRKSLSKSGDFPHLAA